jgi:hypothetical protein
VPLSVGIELPAAVIPFFKISFRLGQDLALSNKDDLFHAKTQSRKENLE